MAKRKNNRKTAPVYSADTLALLFVLGLLLAALGVCIFLATDLGMGVKNGGLFEAIDTFFRGLFGAMTYIVPGLLLWAGTVVILSSQRAVHPKPLLWSLLAFFGICTAMDLLSYNNAGAIFAAYSEYGDALQGLHGLKAAGGSFGALLGWPMYSALGVFLSCVIVIPGTLAALAMATGMTPSRIKAFAANRQQRQPDPKEDRKRLAWQQKQEEQRALENRQREEEYRRQQEYARQQLMQQYQNQPGAYTESRTGYSNGVERFTEQTTERRAADRRKSGQQSVIFDRRQEPAAALVEKPVQRSRIFGRREKDDGLSETPASEKYRGGMPEPANGGLDPEPQGTPAVFTRPSYAEQVAERRRHTVTEQEPVFASGDPEEPVTSAAAPVTGTVRNRRTEENAVQTENDPAVMPARTARKTHPEPAPETKEPVVPAFPADPEPMKEAQKPAAEERPSQRSVKSEQVKVPVTQMTVGVSSYKPELKLPPKDAEEENAEEEYWEPTPYNRFKITLLKQPQTPENNNDEEDLRRARRLEETLAAFKVTARVVNVTHGPAISRFELELATGIKVNKVLELERDIACGMEATSVRIEAPIPGKSLVGVEVPNPKTTTVTLREVLESEPMQNAKSILTVALGKDIAGTPVVCDLAKMPHMLIAGATGSGKSVCINTIINSLIYRASPDEVKLILVDPKVVELKCYNGIPHLLIPVVNEPRKAATALAWAVAEMMERYDKFAQMGVRNLEGYNDRLKPNQRPMPRIVVIIDELADLMMTCKKDVEDYICRLTQLARAAGIHLIVATQRPSVDVITGLIKANIPSRIAFKTASYVDSRTILDRNGSEQLLGWGDMLYLPTGSFAPTRIQGCFVSDAEVQAVTDEVRRANPATYDPDVLNKLEELGQEKEAPQTMDTIGGMPDNSDADSDLFEQCVEMAIQDGQISTSTLQRRLKIGYSRAGRLTDQLEERGIISAKDGSKPRKCLITREEWEEIRNSTEDM